MRVDRVHTLLRKPVLAQHRAQAILGQVVLDQPAWQHGDPGAGHGEGAQAAGAIHAHHCIARVGGKQGVAAIRCHHRHVGQARVAEAGQVAQLHGVIGSIGRGQACQQARSRHRAQWVPFQFTGMQARIGQAAEADRQVETFGNQVGRRR